MPLTRVSPDKKFRRDIAFRAWHSKLKKMLSVRSCNFDDMEAEADVAEINSTVFFRARMGDLVLLQDVNLATVGGDVVYEGDIVIAQVQNVFGSFEDAIGEVIYDDATWGYSLKFYAHSGLPTGEMLKILNIIGNVYEGITKIPKKKTHGSQEHHKKG